MNKNRPNGKPKKKKGNASDIAAEGEVATKVKTGRAASQTMLTSHTKGAIKINSNSSAEIIRKTAIIISRCSRRMT